MVLKHPGIFQQFKFSITCSKVDNFFFNSCQVFTKVKLLLNFQLNIINEFYENLVFDKILTFLIIFFSYFGKYNWK